MLRHDVIPSGCSDHSSTLGELTDDESADVKNSEPSTIDQAVAGEAGAQLLESIRQLGRLVHTRERTFDTFHGADVESDCIIQDLNNILDAAKKHAVDTAEHSAVRAIAQFTKAHGNYKIILNAQGMREHNTVKAML